MTDAEKALRDAQHAFESQEEMTDDEHRAHGARIDAAIERVFLEKWRPTFEAVLAEEAGCWRTVDWKFVAWEPRGDEPCPQSGAEVKPTCCATSSCSPRS